MPIYEYECQKCRAHIEILQKISDKPLSRCKKCGGRLEKQWSNTSFQFKGEGWYVTDYAGRKTSDKEDAPAKATEKDESKPKVAETTAAEPASKGAKSKTKASQSTPAGSD